MRPSIGRQSVGMGRLSTGAEFSRFSVQSSSARRPSIAASRKPTKEEDIQGLMRFFEQRNASFNYSEKSLRNPQLNEFRTWLEFILKCIDKNFKAEREIEKSLPQIFLTLNYPYVIKPSMCITVNSPHNWPSFLKALHWLTKVAEGNNTSNQQKSDQSAYITAYTIHCCRLNEGEDPADVYKAFSEMIVDAEAQTEEERELEELNQRLAELRETIALEETAVSSAESEKSTQSKRNEQAERDAESKRNVLNKLVNEKNTVGSDRQSLTEKVESHNQEAEDLKKKIEAQPMTPEEASALLKRRAQLREEINEKKDEADALNKKHTEKQNQFQKISQEKQNQFKKLASELGGMAREVRVSPDTITQFELSLFGKNRDQLNTDGMSGNVAHSYQTLIRAISEGIRNKITELGLENLEKQINKCANDNENIQVNLKMAREGYELDLESDKRRTGEYERLLQESREQYEAVKTEQNTFDDNVMEKESRIKGAERIKNTLLHERMTASTDLNKIEEQKIQLLEEVVPIICRVHEEIEKLGQSKAKWEQVVKNHLNGFKKIVENIKEIEKAIESLNKGDPFSDKTNFLP
ncbi:unnamed protein product [Bursaphelenchus xylophilus]|uniref:Kinetochore protein NDC80 n=1 Tax=Bursaphelenchus xylophilus TaxID=6326 RepID=A0A1I7RSV6_BURXY|nr:unnamed protein product [Bursaphelenchus xylophilus]CAG9122788.1 unnamed protein product [Bursaphelenchus xylophilus]